MSLRICGFYKAEHNLLKDAWNFHYETQSHASISYSDLTMLSASHNSKSLTRGHKDLSQELNETVRSAAMQKSKDYSMAK